MPARHGQTTGRLRGERVRLLAGVTLALLAHGAVIAALQKPNSAIVGAGGIVLDAVGIDIVDSSVLESRARAPTPGGDVAPEQMRAEEGDPTPPAPPAAETPPSEAKPRPPEKAEEKKEEPREVEKAEVKPPPPDEKPPEKKRETQPPPPPQHAELAPELAPEGPPPPAKEPDPKPTPPEKPIVAETPRPPEVKEDEPPKPREEPKKEEKKEEEAPKPKPAPPPQTTGSTGGAVVRQSMASDESGGREAASPGEKARYQAMLVKLIAKARPNMRTIKTSARGTTRVAFQLAPDGALVSITVKSSSGSDTLDEAAITAIRSVKFPSAPHGMSDKERFFEVPFIFR